MQPAALFINVLRYAEPRGFLLDRLQQRRLLQHVANVCFLKNRFAELALFLQIEGQRAHSSIVVNAVTVKGERSRKPTVLGIVIPHLAPMFWTILRQGLEKAKYFWAKLNWLVVLRFGANRAPVNVLFSKPLPSTAMVTS